MSNGSEDTMGRPKKEIDPEQVRKLAGRHLTVAEIADVMGCNKKTLERRFVAAIEKGRNQATASIKRTQFKLAVDDENVTMLIWLGKQYCGQADKQEYQDTDVTVTFTTQAGPPEDLRRASAVKKAARLRAAGNGNAGGNGAAAEDGVEEADN